MVKSLEPEKLRKQVSPEEFAFETTGELPALRKPLGQERALEAIEFGLEMQSHGYNLFVLGQPGSGKQFTTSAVLEEISQNEPVPPDWVYVFNFDDDERPCAISMPAGMGEQLRDDVQHLVDALSTEVPKAFAGEAYAKEKAEILRRGHEEKNDAFHELEELANSHSFLVQRSADGMALIYTHDNEPLSSDDFEKLGESEQKTIHDSREVLQEKLRQTIRTAKKVDKAIQDEVRALDNRVGLSSVGHEIDALEEKYKDQPRIGEYLRALETDILFDIDKFRTDEKPEGAQLLMPFMTSGGQEEVLKKYQVNLLVNNKELKTAPVIFETNPNYLNLVGRIEHRAQYGAFITDFTMIKAGAFHQANGGYLVLNAREMLMNPYAYEALKRVLKDQCIHMEDMGEQYRLIATASLRPEPIPARLKVVLMGTPWLYYLLQQHDEDFHKLFKVKGEFANEMADDDDNRMSYAYLITNQCQREELLPFHREAVAQVVEQGFRLAGHQEKLSTHFLAITDLVREAHHWAKKEDKPHVEASHIETAIDRKIHRNDYLEQKLGEMIEEGTILIDIEGEVAGQINGLSVYDMGDYAFGKPSRVTARVFLGKEGVTNIERESELGGNIYNKGVLILQGFFGSRYAQRVPVAFAATLCFEQSYGGVEGDSASAAELFALISALTNLPIRQDLAVTGSINQMGQIQSIGGVNLKVEGFYKTCKLKGLTGTQGVVIPQANVKNLMLREEVVEAVRAGNFHIYPIATVDEGLELLTGVEPGVADPYGEYPPTTINAKVIERLERVTQQLKKLHAEN